ncbi:aminotransferase class I/II-fold pyridoxal phosphate-dependent enzyme [Fluviispira multicolorata]|uniref:Aminotransferase class I/II-fold pyridoxal phosphate-dependent enzyme n=1 Tax=Fluviispira multicolorata TaxID=2654512 RepID=A0A833JF20_9BACT|nr:aminotransferase class I/II-fold pyridoxal phosphate-dependent enzyme [Fluviispira multicolorata]KAB8033495.1 aminotransferase class I/II-fold pyridoxal phosphate-dependent enzyme [Fluviispira multicolorata]
MKINELNSWLLTLKPFALTKNDEIKEKLTSQGIEVFDFTLGDPKEPTPSFIKQALISGITDVSQYPQNPGSPELRRACVAWAKKRLNVDVNCQTEVISSNGSKEAVFHIPQLLLNSSSQRRMVIFPEPGYPVYRAGTILAGGIPYENPLKAEKNYVFDPTEIPEELLPQIAAIWLCYPHNPTGATITHLEMEKIYSWALKHDIIILSDECYMDMFYDGKTIPTSFLEISKSNQFKNVLSFFSLSKRSGMTGYRSGFVAGQAELIGLFAKYRLNVGLGTPDFVQKAAIAAWGDTEHVLERNRIFSSKRKSVDKFFKKNSIKVLPSNATFYVWGEIPESYQSGVDFINTLLSLTGIMATPGNAFGNSCDRNFRMALVPTVEKINECLNIWQTKIDSGEFKL